MSQTTVTVAKVHDYAEFARQARLMGVQIASSEDGYVLTGRKLDVDHLVGHFGEPDTRPEWQRYTRPTGR